MFEACIFEIIWELEKTTPITTNRPAREQLTRIHLHLDEEGMIVGKFPVNQGLIQVRSNCKINATLLIATKKIQVIPTHSLVYKDQICPRDTMLPQSILPVQELLKSFLGGRLYSLHGTADIVLKIIILNLGCFKGLKI